jgi:aminopeptidase N
MEAAEQLTKKTPETTHLKNYTAPAFLIETIDLTFDLGEEITRVKSVLAIKKNPDAKEHTKKDLALSGESLKLINIYLNDELLDKKHYQLSEDSLTILNVPDQFKLEINNEISPINNTALSGLYVSRHNFCTQCEAEGFRRITYFLDRPDVMARYTTTIIANEKMYPTLLSNGNPIASGKLADGQHWVTWQDPFKKPSYLFALVAGNFECLEDQFITQSGRTIALRIYVEKGDLDKCDFAMQAVKRAMRWDEEKFGREYDLAIYMIVAVSDFNMGAMENKGLNVFNTQYILANAATATDHDFIQVESVIAHEYFHNWSGNRITCRDWFQLSLKEGLTIFRDQSFTEDMTSKTVARIADVRNLRNVQFSEDAGPLAHSVRPESYIEINNFYTSTIYEKGAEVIRMMQTLLGENLFRQGMDLYFSRHDGQAVTIEEFVKAMEDASGFDLQQFRLWYTQIGTPVLDISDEYDAEQKKYTLTVKQSCPNIVKQPNVAPLHIPLRMALFNRSGGEPVEELLQIKDEVNHFIFEDIRERPIPSLLRNFSAPVKINYDYTDDALLFLFRHDSDDFNRWEAGQQYATRLILQLVKDCQNQQPLQVPEHYFSSLQYLIKNTQYDKWLLTELLTLPTEKYLSEQMSIIDIDGIHAAREHVLLEIARKLKSQLIDLYHQNHEVEGYSHFNSAEVAKRKIKNICLAYLMLLPDSDIHENFGICQFNNALSSNMTDTLAAFKCLVDLDIPARQTAIQQFYQQWQHDLLVVDKWFSVQAISNLPDTLERVQALAKHPAFDIKNPNKVYSLIGAFCQQNAVRFHDISGAGYQFLTDKILQLDALNPQLSARMIRPLIAWKRYDQKRQQLMRTQLERILQHKGLSNDVYELVTKSVGVKNDSK